jgi:hypothetical protein
MTTFSHRTVTLALPAASLVAGLVLPTRVLSRKRRPWSRRR